MRCSCSASTGPVRSSGDTDPGGGDADRLRLSEEASAVSGVGWLRTVRGIVLPQLRVGVAGAWVVAFVLAFGELGASILVAPPGEATLPIRIYTHHRQHAVFQRGDARALAIGRDLSACRRVRRGRLHAFAGTRSPARRVDVSARAR